MNSLEEKFLHKWLSLPYMLHANIRRPSFSKGIPTILFIHGLGNTNEAWQQVTRQLPPRYRIISIDLLGFGQSAKPTWATYDAKLQARSVIATYFRLGIRGRITIVGHSLGSLVAVEIAKRYPLIVKSLILCSPPFYRVDETKHRLLPSSDKILRDIYQLAKNHPEQFIKMSTMAMKLGLVNKSYNLNRDNAAIYMNALEASIINQTSLQDAAMLKVPIHIIRGRIDPIVVAKNIRHLAKINKNVMTSTVLASHEVAGTFVKAVAKMIQEVA
jgi:pimeloyl-ACP methyl ester carboxylesterase